MKNTIKYLLILLAAPVVLSGCLKEEFPLNGTVTPDQVAESPQGLEAASRATGAWLNESMTILDAHYDFGFPSICLALDAMTCDVAIETYGYDAGALYLRVANGLEETSNHPYFFWMYFYRMIYLANNNLNSVNTPADTSDIDGLSESSKSFIGQMLAMRAMSYLYLARIFEYKGTLTGANYLNLTVPYIGQETTESEARNNPRVPHDEMYNNIILRDLNNAVKYLDGYKRDDKTQVDQSIVYGLLARTYLYMGEYTKAAEAARAAIDLAVENDGATMLTEDEWTNPSTGFNTMSTPSWMWAIHVTSDDAVVQTGICNWPSFMASEASFGYCGAGNSQSAKLCDAALYAKIPNSDWRKKSWLDADRSKFDYNLLRDEDWVESCPDLTNIKFRPGGGNTSDYSTGAVADFPMMRIEEMYLIEAEGVAYTNPAQGAALLTEFAQTRDMRYTCTATDFKGVQDACFLQRQIELWGEGHILFDYKRLDKPQLRGYTGTNHFAESRYNSPDGNAPWTTPQIPQSEWQANVALANAQNPSPIVYRGSLWR